MSLSSSVNSLQLRELRAKKPLHLNGEEEGGVVLEM